MEGEVEGRDEVYGGEGERRDGRKGKKKFVQGEIEGEKEGKKFVEKKQV